MESAAPADVRRKQGVPDDGQGQLVQVRADVPDLAVAPPGDGGAGRPDHRFAVVGQPRPVEGEGSTRRRWRRWVSPSLLSRPSPRKVKKRLRSAVWPFAMLGPLTTRSSCTSSGVFSSTKDCRPILASARSPGHCAMRSIRSRGRRRAQRKPGTDRRLEVAVAGRRGYPCPKSARAAGVAQDLCPEAARGASHSSISSAREWEASLTGVPRGGNCSARATHLEELRDDVLQRHVLDRDVGDRARRRGPPGRRRRCRRSRRGA